jgi:hypothetical protein
MPGTGVLCVWVLVVLLVQFLDWPLLVLMSACTLGAALVLCRSRMTLLIRRSRWLLLTVSLLFAWGTPGLIAPDPLGKVGVTIEGLWLAAEHDLRLLLLLASVALVQQVLGESGFMAAIYSLCAPLPEKWRERVVVRLFLVMQYAQSDHLCWRDYLAEDDDGQPHEILLPVHVERERR